MSAKSTTFHLTGTVITGALAALSWFAWLGWDNGYQTDTATGAQTGPYETWQVAGCAVSLLVVLAGALWVGVQPVLASAAVVLAFTVAWTVNAASTDESGLYGVGTIMMLAGLSAAAAILTPLVLWLRRRGG